MVPFLFKVGNSSNSPSISSSTADKRFTDDDSDPSPRLSARSTSAEDEEDEFSSFPKSTDPSSLSGTVTCAAAIILNCRVGRAGSQARSLMRAMAVFDLVDDDWGMGAVFDWVVVMRCCCGRRGVSANTSSSPSLEEITSSSSSSSFQAMDKISPDRRTSSQNAFMGKIEKGSSNCMANSSTPNKKKLNTELAGNTAHSCPAEENAEYKAHGSSNAHKERNRAV
mmetsp:Transcript_6668/g.14205  ORF Transcript_6668/g.14205 Transcript_6668/m.14205 type:complete len:224 (+) Transcript_6668:200-871(+)